ncbi:putative acyl-[acyl-carrier-protein]--UDP-N-acetylglucosamine O-acyltransferase mitochondrial [Zea mays]|jgi:hypothetical protein|uniref:Putative acyl-[acyl-carrier-protein]--UDP-N-acetylglucosamine O-acyltransferase mitochondrial n=1 Tax=Zea mays TaxID=4577 RepID=A0A1D6G3E9_MAIZE|nr:putative acyl-[acyl-carrier-protein]--UDP-N-acetylglucosamine O-acyltransferase mitochondrial [Zea mays]
MLFSVQTNNARFLLFRLEMNAFYILVEIMRSESTALFTALLNLVTARYLDFLLNYNIFTAYIPLSYLRDLFGRLLVTIISLWVRLILLMIARLVTITSLLIILYLLVT